MLVAVLPVILLCEQTQP